MKHLIKSTLRRLSREKVYAFVNITGLTIGIASALLIFMFIRFETTYDTYHTDHENIYRVGSELSILDQIEGYAVSSAAAAPFLHREFEEIKSYLRIFYFPVFLGNLIFQYEGSTLTDDGMFAADSTFFDFFTCTFISGNAEGALDEPFSLVVTRSMAEEVFGHTDLAGKRLTIKDAGIITITAVIEDPPLNSHFQYKSLMSLSTIKKLDNFFSNAFIPGITWETFENTMGSFIVWSYIKTDINFSPDTFIEENLSKIEYISGSSQSVKFKVTPIFQPLSGIHLDSDLLYELTSEISTAKMMNREVTGAFIAIAFFLLIVAAINSTIISISHSNKRKKEMAMLKILGNGSRTLFLSFYAESFISSLTGLLLALLLLEIIIGPVNNLLNVSLGLHFLLDGFLPGIIFAILIFTAFFSGIFPALYFSFMSPARLLGGRFRYGKHSLFIQKIFMMVQFAIATFMIVTALNIQRHYRSMQSIDWGFDSTNIAAIKLTDSENKKNYHLLDSLLNTYPQVHSTAKTNYMITTFPLKHSTIFENEKGEAFSSFYNIYTTRAYLNLVGIKTTGNIDIPEDFDKQPGVLVNNALVDSIYLNDPTGKKITTHFQFLEGKLKQERQVSSVVENFHYILFNQPVQPIVILPMGNRDPGYLAIKFNESNKDQQHKILEDAWKNFEHINRPEYFFISDNIETYYAHQRNLARFFSYFAYMCIIIAFLGIFGITAYNISRRKAEISIRKALGAGESHLFVLVFKYYFWFFIIGYFIGIVISRSILEYWLSNLGHKVPLTVWHFLPAMLLVLFVVFIAVAIQIVRLRNLNPSLALRQE
ncbi:MAG: ABC transporter permease [Bacteroidales bacterium]